MLKFYLELFVYNLVCGEILDYSNIVTVSIAKLMDLVVVQL